MSVKEYKVPGELDEIMEEGISAELAMNSAVKGFFKYQLRNAMYLGKISRGKKLEFWEGVYSLYPELEGKKLSYDSSNGKLTVAEA